MNYTTEPNVKIGLYSDLDAIGEPMIASEEVVNRGYEREDFFSKWHELVVRITETGRVCVYDSLAQRGGKSLDPDVELHRMMLIIALARCVPGFATYMGAMFEAMTQNGSKSIGKCPYDKMLSDAALEKAPAWLEDMYDEAVIFDL